MRTDLNGNPIVVRDHCYGCTAGQGSSCGGALKPEDGEQPPGGDAEEARRGPAPRLRGDGASPPKGARGRNPCGESALLSLLAAVFNRAPDVSHRHAVCDRRTVRQWPRARRVAWIGRNGKDAANLVFNGDFNWFNIARRLRRHQRDRARPTALRGNVETELAGDDDRGCGCGYPET